MQPGEAEKASARLYFIKLNKMITYSNIKYPLMYNGWIIKYRATPYNGMKFCAYNYATDTFINPLYNTWDQLKLIIDNLKN